MMRWKKQGKTCVKRVLGGTMAAMLAVSGMNLTGTSTAQAASVKTEQDPMKIRFQPKDIVEWRTFGDTGTYGRKYRQGWRTIDVRLCEISTERISERR